MAGSEVLAKIAAINTARASLLKSAAANDSRGIAKFFDGKQFDPADPQAYPHSLAIKRAA